MRSELTHTGTKGKLGYVEASGRDTDTSSTGWVKRCQTGCGGRVKNSEPAGEDGECLISSVPRASCSFYVRCDKAQY